MVSTAPPSKATSTWVSLSEPIDAVASLPEPFERWFASRGWAPRAHQLELLAKARAGRSVLLIAPTGAGKTLAGFLPTLVELSAPLPRLLRAPSHRSPSKTGVNALMAGEGWGRGAATSPYLARPDSWRPP